MNGYQIVEEFGYEKGLYPLLVKLAQLGCNISAETALEFGNYSITSLFRTPLSRILDNPYKFWPPEN